MATPNLVPAYLATDPSSPLNVDKDLYRRIANTAENSNARELVDSFIVPPRSGRAWHVPQGCIFRLSTPEGPQVGDLNIWHASNARERFWAKRSAQLARSHVSTFDRLWSCLPYMRPMTTIIADTFEGWNEGPEGSEKWRAERKKRGGRVHDLMGTRCDPYVDKLLSGQDYDYHCHSNLVRSILPFGLNEFDVHDVINVFQVTALDEEGRYCMGSSPSTTSSYLEFFAELPLLCALSTCPGGDLSEWGWDYSEKKIKDTCKPIKVEVYRIADAVKEEVLRGWTESECPKYKGNHGIKVPEGEGLDKAAAGP